MTTNHHTPHTFGDPLTAAELNAPLGQLDQSIATVIATGSGASTTLTAQANSGQASLTVASSAGFLVGDPIYIGTGATFESRIIATVPNGTTITVTVNLTNTYAIGKPVSKSPVEIVAARGTFTTLGGRVDAIANRVFDVKERYGAKGDGATDDTAAINAAIAAAAQLGIVFFPPGTYKITAALGPAVNHSKLRGAGSTVSIIRQYTNNIPILQWGGYTSSIEDLGFQYNTPQGVGNTAAVGLELYAPSWCTIDRIRILDAYKGIQIKQAGTTVGGGGGTSNYVASCSFRDINVEGYTGTGIELISFAGGSSGCVFGNIYINNRAVTNVASVGLDLGSMADSVFNQLNVENAKLSLAIQAATSKNLVFNSIHLEQLVANSDFNGFVFLNGGGYVINGLLLAFAQILVGNVANRYSILRVNNDTRVMLRGLSETSTTRTTANFDEWQFAGTTDVAVHAEGVKTTGTTSVVGGLGAPGVLRQRNGSFDTNEVQGDVSPTLQHGVNGTVQRFATALTANRTITLSTTGAVLGARFRIVRTGLGAFTLDIGGLKTIPSATAAFVDVMYDGAAWRLVGYGTL